MKNFFKTLFVGINVSSKTNVLCSLDFEGNEFPTLKALNNQNGTQSIVESLLGYLISKV